MACGDSVQSRHPPFYGNLISAGLLFVLGSADLSHSRGLGPLLGEFSLEEIPMPALKRSAESRPVPKSIAVQAMARLGQGFQPASLAPYGWRLVAEYHGFATLEGDPATLSLLQALAGSAEGPPGLLEMRPSRAATGTMQTARRLSRVDGVLAWGPTPAAGGVSGKGVLFGILDYGFDTRHPAFLDTAGKTRWLGIWDPNRPDSPGAPFGRGQLKWQAALAADPDFGQQDGDLHGTLVASIAAGSDRASPYYGVAPDAALLGVTLSTRNDTVPGETNIMQGIQWIFRVADSLGLPCVVNLSLGNQHAGPHDGTSLFDRFLDSISAPGRIVVGAAGNDGAKRLHARFALAAGDTAGTWCAAPGMVDLWGEAGKAFRVQVLLMDSASGAYMAQTDFLSTANGTGRLVGDSITWTEPGTGRKVPILIFARPQRSASENGRTHMEVMVQAGSKDTALAPRGLLMGIRVTGSGVVHAWNAASDSFVTAGVDGYAAGDNEYTVSEIGGTAKRILSVGAYVSTSRFRDYNGVEHADLVDQEVGESAVWSSRGPTLDGRIKPDLSAPGRLVVGAMSRALATPPPWMLPYIAAWPSPPGLENRYLGAEGTSESAPIVAGTVALMLEADPGLTPEEARTILAATTYKDAFTGPLTAPDSRWGYGKLDAAAAVRALKAVPVRNRVPARLAGKPVTARFVGGSLRVTGLGDGAEGGLFDWRGRLVSALDPLEPPDARQARRFAVRSGDPGPGVYFAVLRSASGVHRLRVCKD